MLRLCKLRHDVKKTPQFLPFSMGKRWTKCAVNVSAAIGILHNWQMKSTRRSHTLKGSHSMGDGRILLKPRRDDSFTKLLSSEPNFGRIHLAGQYL
jgi:hypothetical protein